MRRRALQNQMITINFAPVALFFALFYLVSLREWNAFGQLRTPFQGNNGEPPSSTAAVSSMRPALLPSPKYTTLSDVTGFYLKIGIFLFDQTLTFYLLHFFLSCLHLLLFFCSFLLFFFLSKNHFCKVPVHLN